MSYLVLARKYRPQCFGEVVAQEHVTQTLANAIAAGRVAHAILFAGPRGTGKTTVARILAKAMNCPQRSGFEPCNQCRSCDEITGGHSVDVFEIDGASNNSVDQVRELRENVKYMPAHGRYKIYIIDEVHMLSTPAFNALLKTLEEPPAHVLFIFATTEAHRIPITILSRCQRYDFRRLRQATVAAYSGRDLSQRGGGARFGQPGCDCA
jgi:DNA polymerase III subunit gamma/tau